MRTFLLFLLMAVLAACTNSGTETSPAPAPPPVEAPAEAPAVPVAPNDGSVVLHSLAGSGLKFDGVYDSHTNGDLHYYMRFFERGNVALVAGRQKPDDPVDLRRLLTQDVKSGKNNVHNVPVEHRGDSLFFTTMANRGAILYAGAIDGDTLRFLKHSKVTGKKAVVNYGFIPDTAPVH